MSDRREYYRKYNLANRDKKKKYYLANKDKIKKYYLTNKEKFKEYHQTESFKKSHRISQWKRYGLIDHYDNNYETIYKIYSIQKMCSVCFKFFNNKKTIDFKCMDHCHKTGKLRRICCIYCNLNVVK